MKLSETLAEVKDILWDGQGLLPRAREIYIRYALGYLEREGKISWTDFMKADAFMAKELNGHHTLLSSMQAKGLFKEVDPCMDRYTVQQIQHEWLRVRIKELKAQGL